MFIDFIIEYFLFFILEYILILLIYRDGGMKVKHVLLLMLTTASLGAMKRAAQGELEREKKRVDTRVFVRTSDNKRIKIERWKINEMKTLLVLLEHQRNVNSVNNPIQATMVTSEELQLVSDALENISRGEFESFFGLLIDEDKLQFRGELEHGQTIFSLEGGKIRKLINAADRVQATGVSALCLGSIVPSDLQKNLLIPGLINPVIEYFKSSEVLGNKPGSGEVAFSPDGNKIMAYGRGNEIVVWDITSPSNIIHTSLKRDVYHEFTTARFSPDGRHIVASYFPQQRIYNEIVLWDISTKEIKSQILQTTTIVNGIEFSPDGKKIVSGNRPTQINSSSINLWDVSDPNNIIHKTIEGHGDTSAVAFSPDNKMLATSSRGSLTFWDISNFEEVKLVKRVGIPDIVDTILFSPDGKKMLSCGRFFMLWLDLDEPEKMGTQASLRISSITGLVKSAAFSPNSDMFVSGGETHNPRGQRFKSGLVLWNIVNPKEIKYKYLEDFYHIYAVAFSPDGKRFAAGYQPRLLFPLDPRKSGLVQPQPRPSELRGYLTLWDISNPEEPKYTILPGHTAVTSVAFGRSGRSLVSIGDGIVRLHRYLLFLEEEEALNKCNFAQAQFLYNLYLASAQGFLVRLRTPYERKMFDGLPVMIQKFLINRLGITLQ